LTFVGGWSGICGYCFSAQHLLDHICYYSLLNSLFPWSLVLPFNSMVCKLLLVFTLVVFKTIGTSDIFVYEKGNKIFISWMKIYVLLSFTFLLIQSKITTGSGTIDLWWECFCCGGAPSCIFFVLHGSYYVFCGKHGMTLCS